LAAAQATDLCGQHVGRTGLEEETLDALASRAFAHRLGGARRQHHHRNVPGPFISRQPLNQIPPVAVRHGQISHNHVGHVLARQGERILAAGRGAGVEALAAQDEHTHLSRVFVVVDYQDHWAAFGHRHRWYGESQHTAPPRL
jgi:hypothetical protein